MSLYYIPAEIARPKILVRDRDFLRSLIHDDFKRNMDVILHKQLQFMAVNPISRSFITCFDYCSWPMQIRVCSTTDSEVSRILEGKEWTDILSRLMKSGGKMDLHVMRVPTVDFGSARYWVVPLRAHNSEYYEGRKELLNMTRRVSEMELDSARARFISQQQKNCQHEGRLCH